MSSECSFPIVAKPALTSSESITFLMNFNLFREPESAFFAVLHFWANYFLLRRAAPSSLARLVRFDNNHPYSLSHLTYINMKIYVVLCLAA